MAIGKVYGVRLAPILERAVDEEAARELIPAALVIRRALMRHYGITAEMLRDGGAESGTDPAPEAERR